ncbi:MAG: 3-oxoacyl-ACP synthase [Flavobacteriales bacterium]|nr:3-oxoacyl-ACP synthase [Flavobacteriales bacterium]
MRKEALVAHLNATLEQRAAQLKAELAATLEARNSDTKSSAGDKHEVGRAMVQQELDQLEGRLVTVLSMQQELARVPLDRIYQRAGFGSLVHTDRDRYFIAIPLGAVELEGGTCYVVSIASPIGRALMDRSVDEVINFNGKRIAITAIS